MKKIFFVFAVVFCSTLLNAQERFFLYGKILGADGTPIPSAQASFSTVIGGQPLSTTEAGPDGSFKLVISGSELSMLKFTAPLSDSITLPILLTTVQHTMSLTIRLSGHSVLDANAAPQKAYVRIHIKDENTELGIAERVMIAFREEQRLDSAGFIFTLGHPLQRRDPDSLLVDLSARILSEENPMHRELFLLRYLQVCTNAKRAGNPAILKMVLRLVEPGSPFWSLAPDLLKSPALAASDALEYTRRVRALTFDPELKLWIDRSH
jgi:hypothetical protein